MLASRYFLRFAIVPQLFKAKNEMSSVKNAMGEIGLFNQYG